MKTNIRPHNFSRPALILLAALGIALALLVSRSVTEQQEQQPIPAGQDITVKPAPAKPKSAPPSVPEKPAPPPLTEAQQHTLDRWMREHDDWKSLLSDPEFAQLFGKSWQRLIVDPAWQRDFKTPAVLIRQNLGDSSATRENTLVQFDFNRIFDSKDELRDFTTALLAGNQQAMGELLTRHLWVIASEQYFSEEPITDRGMTTLARPDNWTTEHGQPEDKAKQGLPTNGQSSLPNITELE